MIEGTSYLTVQVCFLSLRLSAFKHVSLSCLFVCFHNFISSLQICGGSSCCLSRSLDNDSINWIPGQTDVFTGPDNLLECADYEVGSGPFTLTAFHDGVDGLTIDWIEVETDSRTVKCYIDHKLDDHSFVKSHCN